MKLTKITAMVAAIATAAGLGAVAASSASAQVLTEGVKTITLNATSADQLTGHTFKVVKVASYDVYGTAPNQSVTLKTEDALKTDIADYLKYPGNGDPLAWAQQQDKAKLDQSTVSPWLGDGTTRGLADKLASKATTDITPTLSGDNKQATFTLTSPGLWLIVDQAATGKSSKALPILAGTPLTINNNKVYSDGRIAMKNQTASVGKTVTDQTVAAGQDASYKITTTVPNYVGYKVKGYQFTVSDKFADDAPLSYKANTLIVKIGDQALTQGTDYTVTGFDPTSKTFTIDLSAYIKAQGFGTSAPVDDSKFTNDKLVGKTVTVEYKATVTGSTGNNGAANTPTIKYPNDPTNNEHKQEVPGTPVKVFNFDYTLVKKDKSTGAALEGAKFAIKNADGKYLAYTATADGGKKWSKLDAKPDADATSGVFTTGMDGKVKFPALDEGKYTIEEIATPTGYVNVGVSFNFTIKANLTGTGADQTANPTYTIDTDSASSDRWGLVSNGSTAEVVVENVKNITQLPLTGGAGTVLFTVVAALLIGAGVTVGVVKSRKVSTIA
ncbi:SpaH/EbpB family LPXTG-anchored major pilin [Bifidobacterium bifidum]|uniref:SpaH/EbpB family LPXTG-anchored major pilin n=1 Tax=Bifidobacterium bifidum TaxID=1681 RepID=UPI003D0742C2